MAIGVGVGVGDRCGVGLVVILLGLGDGLKLILGSNIGAVGCFWGIAFCSFFAGGDLGRMVSRGMRMGENGMVAGDVDNCGVVGDGTAGRIGDCGIGVGGAWGMRCSSFGVSWTTLTVPGSAVLGSRSAWVKKGKLAPSVACSAIDPRIAIAVGSSKLSKKLLRLED